MDKWLIRTKKADFTSIGKKYGISPILSRIIRNRNIVSDDEINTYLNGTIEDMHSPWKLKDIDKAVNTISVKILQKCRIRVISDYDIDGICSGYILGRALTRLGAYWDIVVPDRVKDGYGINENLIEAAYNDNIDTIITCDNGISAYNQVEYANNLGLTVIITDHHEIPFEIEDGEKKYIIPNAAAVVNPKQADCQYEFKELCGAGVAYKLIEALYDNAGISRREAMPLLEFVAIATIGDVVKLQGENRIITKYGLKLLHNTNNLGLKALINANNLNVYEINSYHIGFILGPCLNASGRLDTAKKAIRLLNADSVDVAETLAEELKELNDSRKSMTADGVKKAMDLVDDYNDDKVLVIYLVECHESLAGIIAGRVRESVNKPTFILTKSGDMVKGSGRSVDGYNMYEELGRCHTYLYKYGGHAMAAGISLKEENVELFRKEINEKCTLTEEDLTRKVWMDMELPYNYITSELISQFELLEPFGMGNEKPVFGERNVRIKKLTILGSKGNAVKLDTYNRDNYRMPAYYFGDIQQFLLYLTDKYGTEEVMKAQGGAANNIKLSITYYPGINVFRDVAELRVVINKYK